MARRDTPELILATSLALFNELGEPNVTTNHIADEADISPGNLYYHFRHKEDIVLELFKRFLGTLQPLLEHPDSAPAGVEDLWFRFHLFFEAKGHYRFLYRNLADLTSRSKTLRRALLGLFAIERQSVAALLDNLIESELLEIGSSSKAFLIENIQLLMTYWIPFADVSGDPGIKSGSTQARAVSRVLYLLVPYMPEPGASQVRSLALEYMAT
jgi:AcrR family transcriptional regulator